MAPETKLARDLAILTVVVLAAGLFLLSGFGFQQRWVLESRAGVAAPGVSIAFRHARRGRDRMRVVTACDAYESRYSRFAGSITIQPPTDYPRACAADDRDLLDALGRARRYHYEGEKLLLETSDGQTLVLRHES
uniref:DUF306 domain-containing protein n=1 Tax=Caulobacter sp. (strain K31) TaxID=366602 RepID=B0SVH3_CAUSK